MSQIDRFRQLEALLGDALAEVQALVEEAAETEESGRPARTARRQAELDRVDRELREAGL